MYRSVWLLMKDTRLIMLIWTWCSVFWGRLGKGFMVIPVGFRLPWGTTKGVSKFEVFPGICSNNGGTPSSVHLLSFDCWFSGEPCFLFRGCAYYRHPGPPAEVRYDWIPKIYHPKHRSLTWGGFRLVISGIFSPAMLVYSQNQQPKSIAKVNARWTTL